MVAHQLFPVVGPSYHLGDCSLLGLGLVGLVLVVNDKHVVVEARRVVRLPLQVLLLQLHRRRHLEVRADPDEHGVRVEGQLLQHLGVQVLEVERLRLDADRIHPCAIVGIWYLHPVDRNVSEPDDGREPGFHLERGYVLRLPSESVAASVEEVDKPEVVYFEQVAASEASVALLHHVRDDLLLGGNGVGFLLASWSSLQ